MDFHKPVLLEEVISFLKPLPSKTFIDATVGNGGHSLTLIKSGATVYGIDQDPNNLNISKERINSPRFFDIYGNFGNLKQLFDQHIKAKVDGLLLDLGLSLNQIKSTNRGFSFNDPDSLDMRIDPTSQDISAENIINTAPFDDLYFIFSHYVQEKFSKPLSLEIIKARQKKPIKSGLELATIIRNFYHQHQTITKIDPSTKIFLALKIAVNDEFPNLKNALDQSLDIVKSGGVVCLISFHSGEDRLIKNFIIQHSKLGQITNLTPSAIHPSLAESRENPLARSALLRSYRII